MVSLCAGDGILDPIPSSYYHRSVWFPFCMQLLNYSLVPRPPPHLLSLAVRKAIFYTVQKKAAEWSLETRLTKLRQADFSLWASYQ